MFTSRSFSKLADIPDYSMALLIHDALDAGAPPSMATPPMTPDEVAASYADPGSGAGYAKGQQAYLGGSRLSGTTGKAIGGGR